MTTCSIQVVVVLKNNKQTAEQQQFGYVCGLRFQSIVSSIPEFSRNVVSGSSQAESDMLFPEHMNAHN